MERFFPSSLLHSSHESFNRARSFNVYTRAVCVILLNMELVIEIVGKLNILSKITAIASFFKIAHVLFSYNPLSICRRLPGAHFLAISHMSNLNSR